MCSNDDDLQSVVGPLSREVDGVYVHIDLDVLDPNEAIANQWMSPGGFTVETLVDAIREIQRHARVKGFGIGSYDPGCDRDGNAMKAACTVAESILEVRQSR